MLLKHELKKWQPEAIEKMVAAKHFAVFDSVGLGKTIETIGAIKTISNIRPIKAIIFAESSTVLQWKSEIEKFSDIHTYVVSDSSIKKRKITYKNFFDYEDTAILVTNWGKLRVDFDLFRVEHIDCLVFDEAQILSNMNATSKYASWLSQKTEYVFALTATPFSHSITQWFSLFQTIGVNLHSYQDFINTYTVGEMHTFYTPKGKVSKYEITGVKNADLLKARYAPYYIKRSKAQIFTDGKIEHNFYFRTSKMCKDQVVQYEKIKDGFINLYRQDQIEGKSLDTLSAYSMTLQVLDSAYLIDNRLEKVSPKLDDLISLLSEIPKSEKVFIYSRFKTMCEIINTTLNEKFNGSSVILHGDLTQEELNANKLKFVEDTNTRFIVCTDIAQRGLNLQVASNMVLFDLPCIPSALFQLVGRLDRVGQKSPFINIFCLLIEDSIEYRIFETLKERQQIFDNLLDEHVSEAFPMSTDEFVKAL